MADTLRVLFISLLLSLSVAQAAPVRQPLADRVEIDWTAGRLVAVGAAAADVRAPGPEIARVKAERDARSRAAAKLATAARALPLAGGGTIASAEKADPAATARLDAALALARTVDVRRGSDGSSEVTLSVPLEALRSAVAPQPTPAGSDTAPTAILVDGSALSPVLGLTVAAGDVTYAGPTVWGSLDARAGTRHLKVTARPGKDGHVMLDTNPDALRAVKAAGALVVILRGPLP
jgi:hypothetical protein